MFQDEILLIPPPRKSSQDIRVSWAYPNTYAVGMAGLGYQLVFRILDAEPDTRVKRVFTDAGQNGWQSCYLLGFSLAWELDYAGVLKILREAGVPALSRDRSGDCPLVFGGGPVLSANPEPFADFFDVVLLGDAESTVPALLEAVRKTAHIRSRPQRLVELSKTPGIYVPSLYRIETDGEKGPVTRITPTADSAPERPLKQTFSPGPDYAAHTIILAPGSSWADMFLVEVARSCPQECRFCLASYLTRPFRATNIDALKESISLGLAHTKRIGLIGPSVTEHPGFDELALWMAEKDGLEIGLPSVRMDTISPELLGIIHKLKQKSITIAIESGSERLRSIMKKNLTDEQIRSGTQMIADSGLDAVKFYGIAGLPGEEQYDLDETVALLLDLKKLHKKLKITFGLSSFVPKAQTPFQWHGRPEDISQRMEYLRRKMAPKGIDVRPESHNWSDVQAYISRADRRVTPLLLQVASSDGKLGAWKKAWRDHKDRCPDPDFYIHRQIPQDEVLPWSHITDQVKVSMLKKHADAAERSSMTPDTVQQA